MKKEIFKKGFTLIELMIVIVILGVLMGTILPRLTGAQARARDTGRVADLNTIAQALETYFDDNAEYPDSDGGCVPNDIAEYLKGNVLPSPPSSEQVTKVNSISCDGGYLYSPLSKNGLPNNGYILASDVETWQNANVATTITGMTAANGTAEYYAEMITLSNEVGTGGLTELENQKDNDPVTIYIVVN